MNRITRLRNFFFCSILFMSIFSFTLVSANTYIVDVAFTVPESVYQTGERMELKGSVVAKNFSDSGTLVQGGFPIPNAVVNLTFRNATGNVSSYNFTTDSSGHFYSRGDFYPSAQLVTAPAVAGDYFLRGVYLDPNNASWFSEVGIRVINQTIDQIRVSTDKNSYNPSDSMEIIIESHRISGDRIVAVTNISINGSIRNATSKSAIERFNCTTGDTGKCTVRTNAPSSYGEYIVELNNFKAFSHFTVSPFSASMYMKDGVGKGYKNTFALGEQGSVEVVVVTNSTTEVYTFSGYIADVTGNVIRAITTTTLNTNNSYTNKFVFTVDSLSFTYGGYYAKVTVTKQGDGSIDLVAPFEVNDWTLTLGKKDTSSGFEYDFSTFTNKTLRFEAYPKYRINGSVIPNINATSFSVNLTDRLNNNLGNANVSWNATCGKGCYDFSITAPSIVGQYNVLVTLSYGGSIQTIKKVIYVIDTIVSAQSTNVDGEIKELFGTNEFVYISLRSYNSTTTSFNLSDAEIFLVTYMNGSDFGYSNVSSFAAVNASNNLSEWAWNLSAQRFKLDVPKSGGVYSALILAQNRSVAGVARFIVNPYDVCSSAKNTPGQVSGGGMSAGSYYYVWQFKTTDTVYIELKVAQANNPLGRATFSNFTSGAGNKSQYGMGSQCNLDTKTRQAVTNATATVVRVVNTQNGGEYAINTSQSICVANDNSGTYTCTIAPAVKWDGGSYSVEMRVTGPDGGSDIAYGYFEARAFYLYGYPNVWQLSPSGNITLTVRMYEAGRNWWSNYGTGGLAGTVTVEKVEYMGKDGDWIWPPVDAGYNVSALNSTSLTSGSGTMNLPVSNTKRGSWDSGYYRVVLKGTDSAGNTDYGYAWFSVKLWDVYGMPLECTASGGCQYKSYFNSKENITLYIRIGNAGAYTYSDSGGQSIGGNVSVGVRKIQDCRTWPCKDLNASDYSASRIVVNQSSGWYWNMNLNTSLNYTIRINKTDGRWGTGWFSVILDVNGTDTGYAWFSTLAFYVDTRPTDLNGTNWKYNIKGRETVYYNVTITKNYKGWNVQYNASDFINATVSDAILRTWDSTTYQTRELQYPEDINISLVNRSGLQVNGSNLINLSYLNGSWPTGYYWGELIMKSSDNDTSTGWLWFSVQPFRVEITNNNYEVDSTTCVNATNLTVREPDWTTNAILSGNYSIISVYENVWTGSSSTLVTYTNYTNSSFNGTVNAQFCPNSGRWGGGSWGGNHYLNVIVKDNVNNDTQTGWLSFRTVPFRVSWSVVGGSDKRKNENVNVTGSLSKAVGSGTVTGNISKIYQWRYDSSGGSSVFEEYSFTVYTNGSSPCSVSAGSTGSCFVNSSASILITAPSRGWRVGSNYLYSDWVDSGGSTLQDYSGIYITGLDAYNGWFDTVDQNGYWKNAFGPSENVTLRLTVRNFSYTQVSVNITTLEYYLEGANGCYSNWCASYTTANWSFVSGGSGIQTNGSGILTMRAPSGVWDKGWYSIRATVSGSAGITTINGGRFQVRDLTAPNVTIDLPALNQTITNTTFTFSATSTKNAVCNIQSFDYGYFNSSNCWNISAIAQTSLRNACNSTYYKFNTTTQYQTEYIYRDYYTFNNNTLYESKGISGISTGGTTHIYTMNITRWRSQDYGISVICNDDGNYGYGYVAIHVNVTG